METNKVKNLLSGAKNISEIIKLIGNAKYSTAQQHIDYILELEESDLKQKFEDELGQVFFAYNVYDYQNNYNETGKKCNLLRYFYENMNPEKCQNVLNYLAINNQPKSKYNFIQMCWKNFEYLFFFFDLYQLLNKVLTTKKFCFKTNAVI